MGKRRERLLTLETERLDRQLMRYETDGFGLWAVILKETGKLIGPFAAVSSNIITEWTCPTSGIKSAAWNMRRLL